MYQKTMIIGNLGKDPEMRYTPSGKAVTNFSVAVSRRWTDRDGQKQEKTTWFRVAAWDKLAEICNQYLKKGSQVMVEGEIEAKAYEAHGDIIAYPELTAKEVKFLGSPSHNQGVQTSNEPETDLFGPTSEEELPF